MNAFETLLNLPDAEKRDTGTEFTAAEIAQQPDAWLDTVDGIEQRRDEIAAFMTEAGLAGDREAVLLLAGAGTSEFIGNAVVHALRPGLRREVISVPTTHLVTHARSALVPGHDYVLLSFARSGNSPESVAGYELVRRFAPSVRQLVMTCNPEGALAKAAQAEPAALCLLMPPQTDDRSLVMTSSFSCMALAAIALCFVDRLDKLRAVTQRVADGGRRVLAEYGDLLHAFATRPFSRACFLGSNTLFGTVQECHLKMQEMTEGRVAARFDSYLGLRHGPQVFVNDDCVVMAALATDPFVRRYELDLLRELQQKKQGCGTLIVCDRATPEIRAITPDIVELFPDGDPVDDTFRVMTDIMVGQILGLFTSIRVGLKPDNPSTSGTINRVVQGITIYPLDD